MRHDRVIALALLTCACALAAQIPMTVAQLTDFVRSSVVELKTPDAQIAQYLKNVKLTQRLDGDHLRALEALGAQPRTRAALEALSAASANLPVPAPVVEAPKAPPLPPEPPPDSAEQKRIVDATRDYAASYTKNLPNFVCAQVTRRYIDSRGGDNWSSMDKIFAKLTYFEGKEDYQVVNVAGKDKEVSYWNLGGTISGGEFGSHLKEIFDAASDTSFHWKEWKKVGGRKCYVFSYAIDQPHSRYHMNYEHHEIVPGYHGDVFVDQDTGVVLRATLQPDLPADFEVRDAFLALDYGYAKIGDDEFLLPQSVLLVSHMKGMATKNVVEFRLYQKYGADVHLKFDTDEPAENPPSK